MHSQSIAGNHRWVKLTHLPLEGEPEGFGTVQVQLKKYLARIFYAQAQSGWLFQLLTALLAVNPFSTGIQPFPGDLSSRPPAYNFVRAGLVRN